MNTAPSRHRALYRHRQTGWPMLASACIPFVCLAAWLWVFPSQSHSLPAALSDGSWTVARDDRVLPPHFLALMGGFALVVLGFSWLTVVLTPTHLLIRFGVGLFRRAIPLARIRGVRVTRTRWYEGWGIHWTRSGMLYNVGGFDAVAIELDNGRTLRIGSDDAQRLRHAIERAIASLPTTTAR